MKPNARILLTGGGSGGHFYPLIALAEALNARGGVELFYIGPEPYDSKALETEGITFVSCPAGKQRRYPSILNFLDIFKVLAGFFVAFYKLYILYPDVVVSKGGYTSVPIILAAAFFRIPIVVHESDTRPGRANALAAHFTPHVAISFEDVRQFFPKHEATLTGIPVRKKLLESIPDAASLLELDTKLPTILILGGSQGAERLNTLVLELLHTLLPAYNVIHQTGRQHFDVTVLSARELVEDNALLGRYRPIAFFDNPSTLATAYSAASLIISRAGTGTIYEIALHGKPSILIPIPEGISHDQRTNAFAYARSGAASVIEEANLRDSLLMEEITRIIKNTALYTDMAMKATHFAPQNGALLLADMVSSIADSHT